MEKNSSVVSFCPMCRTRIEKNRGCNHMTCGFCKYEFCWVCGASAVHGENHFEIGNGCGVALMEEDARPGQYDGKEATKKMILRCAKRIGKEILTFIFFPLIVLVMIPF